MTFNGSFMELNMKINVNEKQRKIILGSLTTSHTWLLDAIGERIKSNTELITTLETRKNILDLMTQLDYKFNDSYRMEHLRNYAKRQNVFWPMELV